MGKKEYRNQLTVAEFNAISHLTSKTHLDDSFDIVSDEKANDIFYDYDKHCRAKLRTGLTWLDDGLAYPLQHDISAEESKLVADVLKEFDVIDKKRYEFLIQDCCEECGEPLKDGICYNKKCKRYDPLSQYFDNN